MQRFLTLSLILCLAITAEAQQTKILKSNGTVINPATDESLTTVNGTLGTTNSSLTTINNSLTTINSTLSDTLAIQGTATVTGTVTANQGGAPWSTTVSSGSVTIGAGTTEIGYLVAPSTSTHSTVNTSTTSTTLLSANTNRRGLTIVNKADDYLYVYFGTTASATQFNIYLPPYATYTQSQGEYDGRIDAILKSGTGTAHIAEITN